MQPGPKPTCWRADFARDAPDPVVEADVAAVADALKSGKKSVIFLSGAVLYGEGLTLAGKVAAATGATLLAQTSNRRIDRGQAASPSTSCRIPSTMHLKL